MNLSVWLVDGEVVHGVILQPAALVWHNGAQWVFSEAAAGVFVRQRIDETIPRARGVLVPQGIKPGVAVVIRGAQTLLAEEFRRKMTTDVRAARDRRSRC